MVPRVAINGGSFKRLTKMPLIYPNATPTPIIKNRDAHIGQPQVLKAVPPIIAAHIITVPTERSIPPDIITNVTPIAINPM